MYSKMREPVAATISTLSMKSSSASKKILQKVFALRGGRKAVAKLETRIKELGSELDVESRRQTEAQRNLRRSERRVLELTAGQEEDRKNGETMQGLVDQLQSKVRTYKKQIEEAEEIAALNLAKFRQVQVSLTEVTGRADISEQAAARLRAQTRSEM